MRRGPYPGGFFSAKHANGPEFYAKFLGIRAVKTAVLRETRRERERERERGERREERGERREGRGEAGTA